MNDDHPSVPPATAVPVDVSHVRPAPTPVSWDWLELSNQQTGARYHVLRLFTVVGHVELMFTHDDPSLRRLAEQCMERANGGLAIASQMPTESPLSIVRP